MSQFAGHRRTPVAAHGTAHEVIAWGPGVSAPVAWGPPTGSPLDQAPSAAAEYVPPAIWHDERAGVLIELASDVSPEVQLTALQNALTELQARLRPETIRKAA